MAITNWNIPWINRKAWQYMTPAPVTTAAWSFVVTDRAGTTWNALYVSSATVQYWYSFQQDAWVQIPSMALAWTFGAWACGTFHNWSNTFTATGWSTTTVTTTSAIWSLAIWRKIRMLSWTAWNIQIERNITNVASNWTTVTITVDVAFPSSVANADTFVLDTWRFFIMNAGTIAAWIFKSYDVATWVVTSLWTTNLPATWWTDWRLVATPGNEVFATWTSTWTNTTTTLNNTWKSWTVNQFTNHQIRITWWTWVWQIRTIASNTATAITVGTAWTTIPDATSTYSIEWNDDFLYLLWNNAVTLYRYSISGATWTVLSPTIARAWAPVAWMSANWIWNTSDVTWANESTLLDGKYIYSFRGWVATLDRYDIPWNTWWAVTYNNSNETFSTWSSYDVIWDKLFIRKDATHRFFYLDVPGNTLLPFNTLLQTDWTALLWDKLWSHRYTQWGTTIDWLYSLSNTWTALYRIMII